MEQNSEYIRIDSLAELEKNLKVDKINKKFIDKYGNRYAVKIGKESKQLEIVRIVLKSELNSRKMNSEEKLEKVLHAKDRKSKGFMNDNTKDDSSSESHTSSNLYKKLSDIRDVQKKFESDEESISDFDLDIGDSPAPDPRNAIQEVVNSVSINDEPRYINDLLKYIEKDKERILSVLNNLKNSRAFDASAADQRNVIPDLLQRFESDVFQLIETQNKKYREIVSYPKSINHYSMNYTRKQKDLLDTLQNDKARLQYVLRWEMQESNLILVKLFSKQVAELISLLNKKEEFQIKSLSQQQQTLFRDSKSATEYCLNDLRMLQRSIEVWIKTAE